MAKRYCQEMEIIFMTNSKAKEFGIGGEVLCYIW
jgi:ribosomal protein S8